MGEANEKLPEAGTSSATGAQNKGSSSNTKEFEVDIEDDYDTAFFTAVSSGNAKEARIVLEKNPSLANVRNWMLPIHIIASGGHRQNALLLYRALRNKFDDLTLKQKEQIFFQILRANIFDAAYSMLKKYPELAVSRNREKLTALHVLARKPPEEFHDPHKQVMEDGPRFHEVRHIPLIEELWTILTKKMEFNEMLEFVSKPSGVLFDAVKSANLPFLDVLLKFDHKLLMIVDSKKQTLFHTAVLYRQESILNHVITTMGTLKDLVMQTVDDDGNNILHMAGMLSPKERFGSSRPEIQIQGELSWFKKVDKIVPIALKFMRNKDGNTPEDIFHRAHKELVERGYIRVKQKAEYGMVVATIIATIVFAASLTVPGHDVSPAANSSTLQKKGWYIIFIMSDAIALFSSSLSTLFFLSVLSSRFGEYNFTSSLTLRVMGGVTTLFVAITTMVVAFSAACFLIFNHQSIWVAYLVASLGVITVVSFVAILYALFGDLTSSLYWSKRLFHQSATTTTTQST